MSRLWRAAAARASPRPGSAPRPRWPRADLPRGARVTDTERNQTQDRQRLHPQVVEPVTPRQAQRGGQFFRAVWGSPRSSRLVAPRLRGMRASHAGVLGPPHRPPRRRTERRPVRQMPHQLLDQPAQDHQVGRAVHRPRVTGIAKVVLNLDLAGFEVRDRRYQGELWIVRYDMAAEAIEHATQRPDDPPHDRPTRGRPRSCARARSADRVVVRRPPPSGRSVQLALPVPAVPVQIGEQVGGLGVLSIR